MSAATARPGGLADPTETRVARPGEISPPAHAAEGTLPKAQREPDPTDGMIYVSETLDAPVEVAARAAPRVPAFTDGSYLTAEVSATAVRANLAVLRGRLAPGTRLCAVVKADCYGHGLAGLVGILADAADCLGVATPEEALALRRVGFSRAVLVFFSACAYADGRCLEDALEALIARSVTLTVVAPAEVAAVAAAARRVGTPAKVHVKVGHGHDPQRHPPRARPGARRADPPRRRGAPHGHVHPLRHGRRADKSVTREQLARFLAAVDACGGRQGLILHAANSAALIDLPETHLDMVRPGIAIYGYQPSGQMVCRLPLRPALRLCGRLMQIKDVPAGSRCGYGLTYTFTRPSRVGLVPVGYGDGYMRCLSGRTTMRVRGCDVPVRGRVAMDQVTVDLTDLPAARVGDEVEIISADPAAPHGVESLARLAGTIPYEITCRLGRRVRRVLVD